MAEAGDWGIRLGHFQGSGLTATLYWVAPYRVSGSQPALEERAMRRRGRLEDWPRVCVKNWRGVGGGDHGAMRMPRGSTRHRSGMRNTTGYKEAARFITSTIHLE